MSNHHAYLLTGDSEAGIASALGFTERELGLTASGNPDVVVLRYGLFSVEEARTFQDAVMRAPVRGKTKVIIVSATRFFYQAQNALLKTFEEPPQGTVLILVVPTEGILLPTMRSRLVALPGHELANGKDGITEEFLSAGKEAREKLIAKLLDRTKSDKDDEKAAARSEAVALIEGLTKAAYRAHQESPNPSLAAFLSDLDAFTPMMHDTSTPLKIIFEHIQITMPRGL
jgi:DNA polymerase III delta prime subunit